MTVMMHRAVVYRAYPTREQAALIERTCGCARFLYNRMLADKIAHYRETGEMLRVTPARYKREFPWLKEVDSFALCNAQLNLDAAYRNFFRRVKAGEKPGFPKYKAKHRSRCCYKTNFVNGNIRFEGDGRYLRLPKLGSVRVRQKREIDPSWRIKSVTVEHTRSGRFEVSVLFEFETQEPERVEPESFVGLDYSSHDLYVTSDGERPGTRAASGGLNGSSHASSESSHGCRRVPPTGESRRPGSPVSTKKREISGRTSTTRRRTDSWSATTACAWRILT